MVNMLTDGYFSSDFLKYTKALTLDTLHEELSCCEDVIVFFKICPLSQICTDYNHISKIKFSAFMGLPETKKK